MERVDALLARLAEVRAAQPDPGDIGAPNERERVAERIALLERYRSSLNRRRRQLAETTETVAALRDALGKWANVEARMDRELTAAQERLAAMPLSTWGRERRLLEGGVTVAERQLAWCKTGPPREGGMLVSGEPFDSAFKAAFGVPPHESTALSPGELRDQLAVEEAELLERQTALDRELASLDQVLRELEAVAA